MHLITPTTPVYAPNVQIERDSGDVNRRLGVARQVWLQIDQDRDLGNRELDSRIHHGGPNIDPRDNMALIDLAAYCLARVERNLRDEAWS